VLYNLILEILDKFPKNTNFYSHSAKREMAIKIKENITKELMMKLSNQAMGALMMALQKSLLEQTDIVPTLESFEFSLDSNEQLSVKNPPTFKLKETKDPPQDEVKNTTGSD
jgi:hypothetical protein|tara:strand:+ start:64 stop:399 length:336 start_codon:yes stop_codon:yes gene_type:complete